jgi:hypothetical protein
MFSSLAELAHELRNGSPSASASRTGIRYGMFGRWEVQSWTREAAAEQLGRNRFAPVDECSRCGQPFVVHGTQVYCSIECAREERNERRREANERRPRECARCGKTFTPTRSDALFCSGRCRIAAHRLRHAGRAR